MPRPRCPNGSQKCINNKCVKKSSESTPRCKKGTRKCANQKCFSKTPRNHVGSKTEKMTLRDRAKIRKFNEEQQEDYKRFIKEHFPEQLDKRIIRLNRQLAY